jgi:ATP-dependent DNA helicase RecG
MPGFLDQEIMYLPGVGPKRAELLATEIGVKTFRDLIYYFPYKYIDRTKFYKISEINAQMPYIQLKGKIFAFEMAGTGNRQRLVAQFRDETGGLELVWFKGVKYQKDNLKTGVDYIVFGKPSEFNGKINVVHPELEKEGSQVLSPSGIFQAYYITSESMKNTYVTSKVVNKLQLTLLEKIKGKIEETLPGKLVKSLSLMPIEDALTNIHKPENPQKLKNARFRLKFEELFFIELKILSLKNQRDDRFKGFTFSKVGFNVNTFYKDFLPFELTNAQKKVIREIRTDVGGSHQMNRLLQGDVGSGKTLVALMSMLIALDNGYQSCLMAPTEILSQQHFVSITKLLNGMNVGIGLLTGSTKSGERESLHLKLKSGELAILIGTHALIEETVIFKNLGLVIIDEQHRFGVAQRAKLWEKNMFVPPHVLVMTATPIPRTLAMTVYGDLDISVIDELPPGRKPIETMHFFDNNREKVINFIRQRMQKGCQVYWVFPLISESEKLDLKNLEEGYRHIVEFFPEFNIGMVHGQMKWIDKEREMKKFKEGETRILVATTVIEVGVDIPNASVMVVESAERFGLSQLHQLRGRVGRGAEQSYCILMTPYKISNESRKRLSTMVRTNDGFEIAEVDLKLRGPGELEGTQQSGIGFDLKIANLAKDGEIIQLARDKAKDLLSDDPLLEHPENKILRNYLNTPKSADFGWGVIS